MRNLKKIDTINLVYLTLSYILFFMFWIKLYIGIPIVLLLSYSIYFFHKNNTSQQNTTIEFDITDLISLIIIVIWFYSSGVGNFVFQNFDWMKHNHVLADLVKLQWPVIYDINDGSSPKMLIFYIAYYLPSALVGKIFNNNFRIAEISLFLFSAGGFWLIYIELKRIFGKRTFYALLIFVFFSGMDIIGQAFLSNNPELLKTIAPHIEWWSLLQTQYSSFTSLIYFTPHQAIAGWLITLMIFRKRDNFSYCCFAWCLSIFYSAYVFLGLGPYIAYLGLKELNTEKIKNFIKKYFNIPIITGLIIGLIIGLYYLSNNNGGDFGYVNPTFKRILRNELGVGDFIIGYFAVLFLEFGIIVICSYFLNKNKKTEIKEKYFYLISIMMLIVLPIISSKDFCMRVSIPAMLMIYIYVSKALFLNRNNIKLKIIIILLLVIGMVTPLLEMKRTYISSKDDNINGNTVFAITYLSQQYYDDNAFENKFYNILYRKQDNAHADVYYKNFQGFAPVQLLNGQYIRVAQQSDTSFEVINNTKDIVPAAMSMEIATKVKEENVIIILLNEEIIEEITLNESKNKKRLELQVCLNEGSNKIEIQSGLPLGADFKNYYEIICEKIILDINN